MEYDSSLGTLLQGVSQQPPYVRPEGKVTAQSNFISDVVEGLTNRPALMWRGNGGSFLKATNRHFATAKTSSNTYYVGYDTGSLIVWDGDGNNIPVAFDNQAAQDYVGTDMRTFVYEDNIYLLNRNTLVQQASGPTGGAEVLNNVGIVFCLGGLFSRTYRMEVRYSDGTTAVGEYTTPDGEAAGDADKSSATYIAGQLHGTLIAHANWKLNSFAGVQNGYIQIRGGSEEFTLVVSDDDDETSLRSVTGVVDALDKLPRYAPHGMLVRISGADAGQEDDFFMRFNSEVSTIVGNGFGDEGVWEEWYDPTEITEWDNTTVPHVLELDQGTFTLKQVAWEGRRVGNEKTNQFPKIIGYPIRDIEGFQSRLVLVAGPYVLMSRTNDGFAFFKETAAQEVATDPIEIASTQQGTTTLDWIIPFDRDLVVLSDPGQGQFIISGANALTQSNASMSQTTSFEIKGGGSAKPVSTGRTILFPFQSGKYSGIKEFFTNDAVTTNGAETLTEAVDRYLNGLVIQMECTTNFNMAVFQTDAPEDAKTLYIHQYLWENTEKVQAAWHKWEFPMPVEHFSFENSKLTVIMVQDDPVNQSNQEYLFCTLDLDRPPSEHSGHHICLDLQDTHVVANGGLTLWYPDARFVQADGCVTPGRQVATTVVDLGLGRWRYTFDTSTVPHGADVIAGVPFLRCVKPTMPFVRNREGRVSSRTKVVVKGFFIEYADTGHLLIRNESRYRSTPTELNVDFFPLDSDADDPSGAGVRSGILFVPWGERSDWSEMTICSDDVRPTTIIEVQWTGEPFRGSRE